MIIPLVSFYVPWKHHRTSGFLMLSNGIKRKLWHEMGYKSLLDRSSIFAMDSCVSCSSCLCFYTWYLMDLLPFTVEVPKNGVFYGPYFPAFGLNTERYGVFRLNTERYGISLCIQSKCGKIQTRKNSVFGHFRRSAYLHFWRLALQINY